MLEGNIKQIDRTSVHKICSGQVVLTLATAVKELVENSIDAEATAIDVILEEHGSKLVEVSDNGKGVKSTDFQSLTLKHHTSKIADFSDLPFVSTFGFRGEALSSLCALCDLEVTTRHVDAQVGANLKFNHNGDLIKNTPAARQVGTTIFLRNLFYTYPVRHKEFLRHIRREFVKMIQQLSAYCLVSINKRITCTHISDKGKKSIVLGTHSSKSLAENIVSLFGEKQMKQLMEVKQKHPTQEILNEYFLPETASDKSKIFKLEGYISSSAHGEGRSSTDRQFFYISGRPCDMPKISKLINEVYHTFNKHQYPFVLLNISLTEGFADVNVTPDKRQIFIPDEKVLLALVKATMLGMYASQPSQVLMTPLSFMMVNKNSDSSESLSSTPTSSPSTSQTEPTALGLKRKFTIPSLEEDEEDEPIPSSFKSQKLILTSTQNKTENLSSQNEMKVTNLDDKDLIPIERPLSDRSIKSPIKSSTVLNKNVNFTMTLPFNEEKALKQLSPLKNGTERLKAIFNAARKFPNNSQISDFKIIKAKKSNKTVDVNNQIVNFFDKKYSFIPVTKSSEDVIESGDQKQCLMNENTSNEVKADVDFSEIGDEYESTFDKPSQRKKKYKMLTFHMDILTNKNKSNEDQSRKICNFRKFRSKILPTDNQTAEEELKKEICKDKFFDMEIIGQFNLGFIIARLEDDLFIIDQHATDEKYNFEQLQKGTILETQQLFQPQELNLTVVSEAILLDNLNIFEMNGFKFQIYEEKSPGEKVQLVSVPVSQNWRFGKEDVDELIFMLTDNPIRMVRPSRVNQMFASRACRKSVMIGTALTTSMMKKLVSHMGEIEQPWNCPHGRPTMRHLFNLSLLDPC